MTYCDSHIHLAQCPDAQTDANNRDYRALACALEQGEFALLEAIAGQSEGRIRLSFGIHPQTPSLENLGFLESLLRERRIRAVGEAGFDFFTPELREGIEAQRKAWCTCLELATKYSVPIVIHNRKAQEEIFRYANALSKLPAVIFHSFPFTPMEAHSLLKHGINAYFSLGKPILKGSKRQIECAGELPLERLLLETDAPFQTLKGQAQSSPQEISDVYSAVAKIRGITQKELCSAIESNFNAST